MMPLSYEWKLNGRRKPLTSWLHFFGIGELGRTKNAELRRIKKMLTTFFILQFLMQTWAKIKSYYFISIWLERSFSHADLGLGKEGTGCSSRVTDACCSYWDLINFIEYMFLYLLYILRTISNTFKWFFYICNFHSYGYVTEMQVHKSPISSFD